MTRARLIAIEGVRSHRWFAWFDNPVLFQLFRALLGVTNLALGRWGNKNDSLRLLGGARGIRTPETLSDPNGRNRREFGPVPPQILFSAI